VSTPAAHTPDTASPPPPAARARRLFPWLWRRYLRGELGWLLLALLLMSLEGAMFGAFSWMVKPLFDEVFGTRDAGAMWWVAGTVLAIFTIRGVAGFAHRVIMAWVGERMVARMQSDLVRHLLGLDTAFFYLNAPGALIERVRGDTQAVITVWQTIISAAGRDAVALVSLLAVAVSIDWRWTLVALVGAPLLALPLAWVQNLVHRASTGARQAAADLATRLDEMFHGIATIKLNRMERQEETRFDEARDRFVKGAIVTAAGQAAIPALMDIIAGIGFFAVLIWGGREIISGEKTVGEFMSFFTAMALVFEPLRRLGNVAGAWQQAAASLTRIRAVFDEKPRVRPPARPRPVTAISSPRNIALEDVHLSYGGQPALRGVSFTAHEGERVALVGPSGAGKTSVFNVLTRLVDPDRGRITLGGMPIRDLGLDDLRRQFAVVSQDAMLFDDTIRANIRFGRPDADEAAVEAAARAAFVLDFAERLPEGLDTRVGPRGANLSGGQRQRVAIARAILRDAPILLLDEPTSALDAESEARVQAALDALAQGRTTLVIAHRLATVRTADRIVVMDRGRVVEEGRHDALIGKGGLYASLSRLQFADG